MNNSYLRGLLLGTLLSAGWGLIACGGSNHTLKSCPPLSPASNGSLAAVVDPLIISEMKAQGLVGAAVAVAKNGTILYSQGYGYANLATCQPVQSSMDFQIGSVTKQFTAAAVLQLQNTGKLNIDDTVITYLPSYAFDPRITLRMLLTQTSGLPNYLDFPDASSGSTAFPSRQSSPRSRKRHPYSRRALTTPIATATILSWVRSSKP